MAKKNAERKVEAKGNAKGKAKKDEGRAAKAGPDKQSTSTPDKALSNGD